MVYVAMNATIGENTSKMKGRMVGFDVIDGFLPSFGMPDFPIIKGFVDTDDSLFDDLTAAERIVSNFGIAHNASGDANGFARGVERNPVVVLHSTIKKRRIGLLEGIASCFGA